MLAMWAPPLVRDGSPVRLTAMPSRNALVRPRDLMSRQMPHFGEFRR
jgi:hypothetical protein